MVGKESTVWMAMSPSRVAGLINYYWYSRAAEAALERTSMNPHEPNVELVQSFDAKKPAQLTHCSLFSLRSTRKIETGKELFINYGGE